MTALPLLALLTLHLQKVPEVAISILELLKGLLLALLNLGSQSQSICGQCDLFLSDELTNHQTCRL